MSRIVAIEIALQDGSIERAATRRIGGGEYLPQRMIHRTFRICTLAADHCTLHVAVVQEILRGKDVRLFAFGRFRAVGGKLGEEVVIVGVLCGARQKILKEIVGTFVVAPEYREIVLHRPVLSAS